MLWKMVRDSIGGLGLVCLLVAVLPMTGCGYDRHRCENGRDGPNPRTACRQANDGSCHEDTPDGTPCDGQIPACACRDRVEHGFVPTCPCDYAA